MVKYERERIITYHGRPRNWLRPLVSALSIAKLLGALRPSHPLQEHSLPAPRVSIIHQGIARLICLGREVFFVHVGRSVNALSRDQNLVIHLHGVQARFRSGRRYRMSNPRGRSSSRRAARTGTSLGIRGV